MQQYCNTCNWEVNKRQLKQNEWELWNMAGALHIQAASD